LIHHRHVEIIAHQPSAIQPTASGSTITLAHSDIGGSAVPAREKGDQRAGRLELVVNLPGRWLDIRIYDPGAPWRMS
jgi:hypothetical protein